MIRHYLRRLNSDEQSLLKEDVGFARARQRRWKILGWITIPIVLVIGIPLGLWQATKDPALGYLAFGTVGVYVLIVVWVYWSNTKEDRRRIKANRQALRRDQTEVIHCQSRQVVRIEEGDLPVLYFYQGQRDTILFCELYQEDACEKRFPNSDFEVAKVYDQEGRLLLLELNCTGEELKALKSLAHQEARELLEQMCLPQDNFVLMEGTLDKLARAVPREPLSEL
jgi:hypothetical protein